MRFTRIGIAVAFLLCMLGVLLSCTVGNGPTIDPKSTAKIEAEYQALRTQYVADIAQAKQNGEDTTKAEKVLADLDSSHARFAKWVKTDGEGNVDLEATTLGALSVAVPAVAPYALLVGAVYKWWQKSKTASSLVKSWDQWKRADPTVQNAATNMDANVKAAVHAPLTKDAKRLIEREKAT